MSNTEKHLYYLTELKDYKVSSKDPDIRGWEVKDLDYRVIGKVDNLLVNKDLGKVVYVDVEVDQSIIDINHDPYASSETNFREFINKEGENHIIIPIGLIELNLNDKYVYTASINYDTFAGTKRYKAGTNISRDYEHHVVDSYERTADQGKREHDTDKRFDTSEKFSPNHRTIDEEVEEKLRREKENLKYKSTDRKYPVSDESWKQTESKTNEFRPEITLDEDSNWKHVDRSYEAETDPDSNHPTTSNEDFYQRKIFHRRVNS